MPLFNEEIEVIMPLQQAIQRENRAEILKRIKMGDDTNGVRVKGKLLLHWAVEIGDVEIINALLARNSGAIDELDDKSENAIQLAVRLNNLEVLKALLKKAQDVNTAVQDAEGNTLLHIAVLNENAAIIEVLLPKMTSEAVNAKNQKGETALFMAFVNDSSCLEKFKNEKVNWNIVNSKGNTLLHEAVLKNSSDLVRYLMGVMGDEEICRANKLGVTPMFMASRLNKTDALRAFIGMDKAFSLLTADRNGTTLLHLAVLGNVEGLLDILMKQQIYVEFALKTQDLDGNTLLHLAILNNQLNLVNTIIDRLPWQFTYREISNKIGQVPLMMLFNAGHYEVVKKFVLRLAVALGADTDGNTLLHLAASAGNKDIVESILRHTYSSSNTQQNDKGEIPVMSAFKSGQLDVVRSLLVVGYSVFRSKDTDGNTLLHLAASAGSLDIIVEIANKDKDVNLWDIKNNRGDTALIAAFKSGQLDVVRFVLEMQCGSLNIQDADGNTILHLAASAGNLDIVSMCLAGLNRLYENFSQSHTTRWKQEKNDKKLQYKNALYDKVNNLGHTAFQCAIAKDHHELMQIFIFYNVQYGKDILMFAASCGAKRVLANLLDEKRPMSVDFAMQDDGGNTLLHWAISNNEIESALNLFIRMEPEVIRAPNHEGKTAVSMLNKRISEYYKRKDYGYTLMYFAVCKGLYEVVQAIWEVDADTVRWKDEGVEFKGQNYLHVAARYNGVDMLRFLTNKGVDVKAVRVNGVTPLHEFVLNLQECSTQCITLMGDWIQAGLDVNAVANIISNTNSSDIRQESALSIVAQKGWADVVRFLLDQGAQVRSLDMQYASLNVLGMLSGAYLYQNTPSLRILWNNRFTRAMGLVSDYEALATTETEVSGLNV